MYPSGEPLPQLKATETRAQHCRAYAQRLVAVPVTFQYVAATLVVRKAGSTSVTELEGSKLKVGVTYDAETFTVPKMTDLAAPRQNASLSDHNPALRLTG